MRKKEIPGSQGQVSLGGSIAFLLRVLPGFAPPLIHTRLWNTADHEPRLDLSLCANDDILLSHVALDRVKESDKRKGPHMPSNRFIEVRLMLEATSKIGAGFGKVSQRWDFKIPSIPAKQATFWC